jgi:glutaredoxin/very-short-patch-repair endonuclease
MSKLIVGVNDLATVNPELAKEWNYEKNEKTPQDFTVSSGVKVWWVCEQGHEWRATIVNRNKGRGCPYCANNKVLQGYNDLFTTLPQIVKEWNYDKNIDIDPKNISQGSHLKVWWKCENGHEWQAIVSNRSKGHGCPVCEAKKRGNYRSQAIKGETDLETINPKVAAEWDYERNGDLLPSNVMANSNKTVYWVCSLGHHWKAKIYNRNIGGNCPYCANKKVLKGFNDLGTLNKDLVKEWNYERNVTISPEMVTVNSGKKVWWLCKEGHEWQASIHHRSRGEGCPYCSGSKTERLVYAYLKELSISFIAEKKFEQDIRVKWFPFDVWISSKRLIIEPDGLQHFTNKIGYFEQDTPFEKRRQNDNIKNQFCLEQRIPILRIPYTYNPDTEKEKIKSMIKDFIETRKIPQEIIDFYEQYKENNNYAEIARKLNELN